MGVTGLVQAALAAIFVVACSATPANGPGVGAARLVRSDLTTVALRAEIRNGLSNEIEFEVPPGTASMLIEIRGGSALFYLAKLMPPSGIDLVEGAAITTRHAREVPGHVNWLFPNDDRTAVEPGVYRLVVRAEHRGGGHVAEGAMTGTIYFKGDSSGPCAIPIDLVLEESALAAADFDRAGTQIVDWVAAVYAQAGITVRDYQVMPATLAPGAPGRADATGTLREVSDLLRGHVNGGPLREDAIHVFVLPTIGDLGTAGYSLGLPGPFAGDRPTAAILVSTETAIDGSGLVDPDQLASTVAHELGHYLGLYHPSEADGSHHDPLRDTPECHRGESCPDEYRANVMTSGAGEARNLLTAGQGRVLRSHPACVPEGAETGRADGTAFCTEACPEGTQCTLWQGAAQCLAASERRIW